MMVAKNMGAASVLVTGNASVKQFVLVQRRY